jgi:hypothetical protein
VPLSKLAHAVFAARPDHFLAGSPQVAVRQHLLK